MNKIRQKLTSQSGASITYALLLFLVCAVVSSVVITAGTAASGRMSGTVDADRKYYAVTSAADLLMNLIEGETVKVIEQTETVINKRRTEEETEPEPTVVDGYPKINDTNVNSITSYDLLTEAAYYYVLWPKEDPKTTSAPIPREINLTIDSGGSSIDTGSLEVEITETVDPATGRMTFLIQSSEDDEGSNPYFMTMIFDVDAKVEEDSDSKNIVEDSVEKRKTTDTTTSELSWSLTSMS